MKQFLVAERDESQEFQETIPHPTNSYVNVVSCVFLADPSIYWWWWCLESDVANVKFLFSDLGMSLQALDFDSYQY